MDDGLRQVWITRPDLKLLRSFQKYREAKVVLDLRFAEFLQVANELIYNTNASDKPVTIIDEETGVPEVKPEIDIEAILKTDLNLPPISTVDETSPINTK